MALKQAETLHMIIYYLHSYIPKKIVSNLYVSVKMQYASRDKNWKLSSSLHRKKRKHFLPLTVKLKGLFRIWKRVKNKGI